jgi:cell division protein FtsL
MSSNNLRGFLRGLKKKTAVVLLLLSIGFVYMLFDSRGLIQRIRLETEKSSLEKKIQELDKENALIQTEIQKLKSSDQEIERIAREKYFMHRNGEKIIKVQPN